MESDLGATLPGVVVTDKFSDRGEYNRSGSHEVDYGPIRDPLYVVIPISVIYVAIFFAGLLGNIVTCIVIARNRYMHTATNYYLFSLAVSDLLLLVSGLPQEMVAIWYKYPYMFGEAFCVLRGLSAETSANASVLTITAFTVERYFAICHPFMSQTMSKLSRAFKLIVAVWVVALSFALPQAMQFGLIHLDDDPSMVMCTSKRKIIRHSFELSTFLFFVGPMTLITVLYVLIGVKLRRSSVIKRIGGSFHKNGDDGGGGANGKGPSQSSRRVIKMLVAIVVAFFICWAPFHAQRLVYIYGWDHHRHTSPQMTVVYTVMTYVSGVLYYVSATINPILYHIMSLKFREAFKDTIARWCGLSSVKNNRGRRYSVLQRGQPIQFSAGSLRGGVTQSCDAVLCDNVRDESTTTSTCVNTVSDRSTPCDRRSSGTRPKTASVSEAPEDSARIEMGQWTRPCPMTDRPRRDPAIGEWNPQRKFAFCRSKFDSSSSSDESFCSVFRCLRTEEANKSPDHSAESGRTISGGKGQEEKSPRTRSSSDSGIVRSRSLCGGFSSNVSNSSLRDYDQKELQEELGPHLAEIFKNEES